MYKKQLAYLIIVATIIRLIVAHILELGNDEVYYTTYAVHLQSNYFDHPPGVAWLIKLFTLNLSLHDELFVRLGPIMFATIGSWLCFKIGRSIRNERTGWYAAILYNTSIYSSIIAGTFILPDSPQVVFWLASLLIAIRIVQQQSSEQRTSMINWLLFGLLNGICILCKVHGIFLWAGFGLYVLFFSRKMLLAPGLYLSVLLTLIIASPIFFWNLHNNFVTWRYHSERVEVKQFALNTDGFIQTIFGQLFYNNPVNAIIIFFSLFYHRKNKFIDKKMYHILMLCGLPIILFTTGISLFRDVLPHWSGPGFLTLSFIAAAYLDAKTDIVKKHLVHWSIKLSAALILVIVIGGISLIEFYPGTIGNKEKDKLGDLDFTLDLSGWRQFNKDFQPWYEDAEKQGLFNKNIEFVDHKWFPAAHIDFYVAAPLHKYVYGVGNVNDLHQYVWLNHYRSTALQKGDDALCIVPSNYAIDVNAVYQTTFASTQWLHTFTQNRSGTTVRYFNVYLLKGYKGGDEAADFKIGN